jgi:hypothetical protein
MLNAKFTDHYFLKNTLRLPVQKEAKKFRTLEERRQLFNSFD